MRRLRSCAHTLAVQALTGLVLATSLPAPVVGAAADRRTTTTTTPAQQRAVLQAVARYEAGAFDDARVRFERLAAEGVAAADHNLASMLMRGEIGPADVSTRERLAFIRMQRAADRGFVTAQHALAQMHEQGRGTAKHLGSAAHWYTRAAQAGSLDAMVEIATAHYLGRGVPRNAAEALRWYLRASAGGDVGAQYLAASIYEHGDVGVESDLRLARLWYATAAAQGDDGAAAKLKALDDRKVTLPATPVR